MALIGYYITSGIFKMAGPKGAGENRLLFLLNHGDSGVLPSADQLELGSLIQEYFSDNGNNDSDWIDSDFEEENSDTMDAMDPCQGL